MIKTNGKRVVYWLGAGASAQALPVVGEMPTALERQYIWIRHYMGNEVDNATLTKYAKYLTDLAKTSRPYGTVDTYARSLYVQQRAKELAELKLNLSYFFLLEQILDSKERALNSADRNPYTKDSVVDPRYMGWLALLVKEKRGLADRVNVISWNYDLQVEHALAKYWQLSELSELHKIRGGLVHPGAATGRGKGLPFLVHLNGIAGHAVTSGTSHFLYDTLLNPDSKAAIRYLFEMYKDYDVGDGSVLNSMVDTFTFAWEEKQVARDGIELAKKVMAIADILVVVGYSFPSFNRVVDKELFGSFVQQQPELKYVVVQNPAMPVETFQRIMGIQGHTPNVLIEKGIDQYHVPVDLF